MERASALHYPPGAVPAAPRLPVARATVQLFARSCDYHPSMSRFSERIGAVQVTKIVQLESMSDALRNSIWNYVHSLFGSGESSWRSVTESSASLFFKVPVDDLPTYNHERHQWLKKSFYEMKWYEVYDYTEFLCSCRDRISWPPVPDTRDLNRAFNAILEEELSGYRFVGGELVPISTPQEVAAIEDALAATARSGLQGAHIHLATALELLAKRPDPDYRNSIKESISAVEAVALQLGTQDSQGLSGALTELGKKIEIHGALRSGFLSLYGYTSDEGGIRHAMVDAPNLGYDEAKYMAITCSAFVNFLAAKAEKAGTLRG